MKDSKQMELFQQSSREDSPARTSAEQVKEQGSSESDPASGRRCFDSSEMYGQRGQLLKMYQPFDLKDLPWFFKISARSGIALNGTVYPLVPLARLTRETGSGYWRTPSSQEPGINPERLVNKDGQPPKKGERLYDRETGRLAQVGLTQQVKMWPTPCANTRPNEGNVRLLRAKVLNGELSREEAKGMLNGKDPFEAQGAVPEMTWPTPTRGNHKTGGYLMEWGGSWSRKSISHLPKKLLNGKLSPRFPEWLMGFPDGWTDLSNSATP